MKERGPGVRGYPFVLALVLSFAVCALAVILHESCDGCGQKGTHGPRGLTPFVPWQAKTFMDTGKTVMGLIAAVSLGMGMRYVSHFTIYGDLYEYGI